MHIIPSVDFSALALELAPHGGLVYRPEALRAFCRANNVDEGAAIADEDLGAAVIAAWYVLHREAGGQRDGAAETIVALFQARR